MKQFIIKYLNNRSDFYLLLGERIPNPTFHDSLKTATFPFEESDAVVNELEKFDDSLAELAIPQALLLDDLLKKQNVGQQLAKKTISIRETLIAAERIESIGYVLFEALSKQDLTISLRMTEIAERRQKCLLNILQLRDDLDFHRFRLP